jgi:hypothetical protein
VVGYVRPAGKEGVPDRSGRERERVEETREKWESDGELLITKRAPDQPLLSPSPMDPRAWGGREAAGSIDEKGDR